MVPNGEEVGLEIHEAKALPESVAEDETQKEILALEPFAVTDPFKVAPEEVTEDAALVVTEGTLAGIKFNTVP